MIELNYDGQITEPPKITQHDYFQWLKQLQEDKSRLQHKMNQALEKMNLKTQSKEAPHLPVWETGDQVTYLKLGKRSHALESKWICPYSIVDCMSPLLYRIEKDGHLKWVHVSQLKLFS